jgi:hypothetical protein
MNTDHPPICAAASLFGKGWMLLKTREQARVQELDPALERGVSSGAALRPGMEFGTDERQDHLAELLM